MISTHILDTSTGTPAGSVTVDLEKKSGDDWILVASNETNQDGRITFVCPAQAGTYRMYFKIEPYFKKQNVVTFFPIIPVIFTITDISRKYHVPLLLNPFGYSTYRGS